MAKINNQDSLFENFKGLLKQDIDLSIDQKNQTYNPYLSKSIIDNPEFDDFIKSFLEIYYMNFSILYNKNPNDKEKIKNFIHQTIHYNLYEYLIDDQFKLENKQYIIENIISLSDLLLLLKFDLKFDDNINEIFKNQDKL